MSVKTSGDLLHCVTGTFHPVSRVAQGRNQDGSWAGHDEFEWGGPYIEGGVWQCTWGVPHDPDGLAEVMGGRDALVAKLCQMLEMPPTYGVGSYRRVIHEMSEMAALGLGQCVTTCLHSPLFSCSAALKHSTIRCLNHRE